MNGLSLEKGCALLITDRASRFYFSSIDIDEGIMLVGEKKVYFTDARYFHAVKYKLAKMGIIPVLYTGLDCVEKCLKEMQIVSIGVDYTKTTLDFYEKIKMLSGDIFDATVAIKSLRQVKTEKEISLIKKACSITEKAFRVAISHLKEGVTEQEIRQILIKEYKKLGANGEAFDSVVAFSKNSAIPHHSTGKTKLKANSVVLIDTGCLYKGYCADLTRTLYFGSPSKDFISNYNAVLSAHNKAKHQITDKTRVSDADSFAREELKRFGLDKYFTHSLGHGVGIEIHEAPTLSKLGKGILRENTVFTIEPGVYFNKKYGIRIEDTVYIRNGKVKSLFTLDKNLKIL